MAITGKIIQTNSPREIRVEATNGKTYAQVIETWRGKTRRLYCVWETAKREPDVHIPRGRVPPYVRAMMPVGEG
jgi:hypothetical protein